MKKLCSLALVAFVLAAVCVESASAQWASLKGQFLFGKEGTEIPNAAKLNPTKDTQVCGKEPLFDESLVVNEENRGLRNVFLWVYKPKKVHPDYGKADETAATIVLDNVWCRFEPHALAVRTDQTFRISNSDSVGHNSLINFIRNTPVNPIVPARSHHDVKLSKPEMLPLQVSCSIHPWMQGRVLVQDHPYMAVTDEDGKFELKNLPAGKLTLKVYHEKSGWVQAASIDGKKATWKKGKYSVTMKGGKDQEHVYTLDPKIFK